MAVPNYQRWMTVLGLWEAATLLSVQVFIATEAFDARVAVFAIGLVTAVNILYAFVDLAGLAGDA